MAINYDFSTTSKEVPKKKAKEIEIRPNYHICNCCGNCLFYWYRGAKSRRGFCKYPAPHGNFKKKKGTPDESFIKKEWPTTHTTCSCDLHQLNSLTHSLEWVAKYVRKDYSLDGTLSEKDNN